MTRNHPDRSGQFMLNNRWLGKLMLKLMLSFSSFARNCPEWAWPLTVTPWRNLRRHLTLKTCTGTIRYDSSKILTFEDIWLPICAQRKFQSFFSCFFFPLWDCMAWPIAGVSWYFFYAFREVSPPHLALTLPVAAWSVPSTPFPSPDLVFSVQIECFIFGGFCPPHFLFCF